MDLPVQTSGAHIGGRAVCRAIGPDLSRADVVADVVRTGTSVGMFRGEVGALDWIEWEHDNAMVGQGLQRALRLIFANLAGSLSKISHVGVGGAAGAVTVATTTLGSPSSIKAISPTETLDTSVAATPRVIATAPFDETEVTFAATRLALLYGSSATDVVDIIGGGGSSPYNRSFSFNFTGAGQFDLRLGVSLGLSATS